MTSNKKRIAEVDIARGITIFLVVMSHTEMPAVLNDVLRTFRMPLFFLVSGYLFSLTKYQNDLRSLVNNRIRTLIIPYFSACAIFGVLFLVRSSLGEHTNTTPPLSEFLINSLTSEDLPYNPPLWFLVCLFCAEIIFWTGWKLVYNRRILTQISLFASFSILGFVIGSYIHLPWRFDIALVAQIFMFFGQTFKSVGLFNTYRFPWKVIGLSLAAFITCYLINGKVDMNDRLYGNFAVFALGGISGSILILQLTKLLKRVTAIRTVFSLFGRESLSILMFHVPLAFLVFGYMNKFIFSHAALTNNWLAFSVWGTFFSVLSGLFINQVPIARFFLKGIKSNRDAANQNTKYAAQK